MNETHYAYKSIDFWFHLHSTSPKFDVNGIKWCCILWILLNIHFCNVYLDEWKLRAVRVSKCFFFLSFFDLVVHFFFKIWQDWWWLNFHFWINYSFRTCLGKHALFMAQQGSFYSQRTSFAFWSLKGMF